MKPYYLTALSFLAIVFYGCSPKVGESITRTMPPVSDDVKVVVFDLSQAIPKGAQLLGTVKVGDNGFSTNCTFERVTELASQRARKAGGNALKITDHKTPSAMGSSCHRIEANILYIPDGIYHDYLETGSTKIDSALFKEGCAVLHFFRFSGTGAMIAYDIKTSEDELICRMTNNSRNSTKVKANGRTTIYAKTESRTEVTVNIQPGYHYYFRCGIAMGLIIGRPTMALVDSYTGKMEYDGIKVKSSSK